MLDQFEDARNMVCPVCLETIAEDTERRDTFLCPYCETIVYVFDPRREVCG